MLGVRREEKQMLAYALCWLSGLHRELLKFRVWLILLLNLNPITTVTQSRLKPYQQTVLDWQTS